MGGDVAIGVVLAVSGILWVVRPDISKRWCWKPAGIAQRPMSPEHHLLCMRALS